jgi:two-component system nitrate/nitrite response regulator NarL
VPRGTSELYQEGATSLAAVVRPEPLVAADRTSAPSKPRGRRLSDPFAFLSPTVTLALVGGQCLLREATASLLAAQDGLVVLGTFKSAAHFLAAGMDHPPAVLLLDCDEDDPGGFASAVGVLSSARVESKIVLLCQEVREEVVRCAIEHRVGGVILKSYSTEDIRAAISYMATGRTVMPGGWQRAGVARARVKPRLSPRHRQILALIAQGQRNGEIATELELSSNTIKFHVRVLYSRLGVRNRVEAARQYAQMTSGED